MRITLPNGKWRKRLKIKALPPFAELHKVRAGNYKIFKSKDKVIFICKNPELALLQLIDQYEPQNIGFVFQNCAVGAHIAVVLREKRIPAIKTGSLLFGLSHLNICTIDAKSPGLQPKERLIYE